MAWQGVTFVPSYLLSLDELLADYRSYKYPFISVLLYIN